MEKGNQEATLVLVGKTGTGKSSIGNVLLGRQEFKEGSKLSSETKGVRGVSGYLFGDRDLGIKIKVVDTPGFMDTSGTDQNVVMSIMELLLEELSDNGITYILFCYSATDMRLDGSIQDALKILKTMMTEQYINHTYLVIT